MDDEKPLDLRDKLAIEILNGMLCSPSNQTLMNNINEYLFDKGSVGEVIERNIESLIRSSYRMADIMRKVRLTVFE